MAIAWSVKLESEDDLSQGSLVQTELASAATWFVKNHDRTQLYYRAVPETLRQRARFLETTCTSLWGVLSVLLEDVRRLEEEVPMPLVETAQQAAAWYQRHKREPMDYDKQYGFLVEALAKQFQVLQLCAEALDSLAAEATGKALREGLERARAFN